LAGVIGVLVTGAFLTVLYYPVLWVLIALMAALNRVSAPALAQTSRPSAGPTSAALRRAGRPSPGDPQDGCGTMKRGDARRTISVGLRSAIAVAERLAGRTSRRLRRVEGMIPVLMYHRVRPDGSPTSGIEPGMFVTAATFERHVRWLAERFELV